MKNHFGSTRAGMAALGLLFAGLVAAQSGSVAAEAAGSYQKIVAPGSLAVAFGSALAPTFLGATATVSGSMYVLPTVIGNVTLSVTDSSKTAGSAVLYMVSPVQINFVVPPKATLGPATVSINTGSATETGSLLISNVSPAILTADGSINGVAAAQVTTVAANGQQTIGSTAGGGSPVTLPKPVSVTPGTSVYLTFYGTGIRNHSLNPVIALVGGVSVPVTFAGAQSQYPGTDIVTVGPIPGTLAGAGTVNVSIVVDGVPANTVQVAFQ